MSKKNIIKAFLISTVTALTLRLFVLEDYRISSDSMKPTLLSGDLVLVSKSAFNLRFPFTSFELIRTASPERSDVVAFTVPEKGPETFIKRVVAVGGDKVEIRKGLLWINNIPASYSPSETPESLRESPVAGKSYEVALGKMGSYQYGPVDIPKDHFFVLGDNRSESLDSRLWGPIPYSCLKGRVALVWLSVGERGSVRPQRWLSTIQ